MERAWSNANLYKLYELWVYELWVIRGITVLLLRRQHRVPFLFGQPDKSESFAVISRQSVYHLQRLFAARGFFIRTNLQRWVAKQCSALSQQVHVQLQSAFNVVKRVRKRWVHLFWGRKLRVGRRRRRKQNPLRKLSHPTSRCGIKRITPECSHYSLVCILIGRTQFMAIARWYHLSSKCKQ